MRVARAIFAVSCLWGAACSGSIGEGTGAPGAPGAAPGGGTVAGTGTGTGAGSTVPTGAEPVASLHKLTAAQFANSVHDLLGSDAPLSAVEPDSRLDGFASVGASSVAISPAGVGLYEAATQAATEYVFADAGRVAKVLSCVPKTTADTACATQGLAAFGRRAFRRTLTDTETARFVTLATTIGNKAGSNVLAGLRHAVWAILQSPSFLYRVELGSPSDADGGRLKYSSFEMASRLASTLWNSVPDDALLDAAAQDALSTPDGVATQAQRLLAGAESHQALTAFVDDLYGMQRLGEATKDAMMFPKWTATLRAAMQEELERRVDDMVLITHGDFLSLFDSKTTFVNNELAGYYGLPTSASTGFFRADFAAGSARGGLLGAGAIL